MTIKEFIHEMHFLIELLKHDYQPVDDFGEGHFAAQTNAYERLDQLLDIFARENNVSFNDPDSEEEPLR